MRNRNALLLYHRPPAQPRCTLQRREQRRIRWHRARGHAGGLSVPCAAARVCVRNFAPCTRHGCLAATASAKGPEVTHGPGPATTPKARAVPPQTATSPLPTHTAAHCPAQAEWQRMTRRSPPRVAGHAQVPASRAHVGAHTPRHSPRRKSARAWGLETCVSLPRRRRRARQLQLGLHNREALGPLLRAFGAVL